MKIYNYINWKIISFFGKSPVINKSYVYLFLVPALAKILSRINSPLKFFLGNTEYEIVLALPFSWKIFFFSALLFSLGALCYNIFAPTIIKENSSFGEFLTDKKNFSHLFAYGENVGIASKWISDSGLDARDMQQLNFAYLIPDGFIENIPEKKRDFFVKKLRLYNSLHTGNTTYDDTKPTKLENSFWTLFEFSNSKKPFFLFLTTVFYVAGFILISIVFVQSILLVLNS